MILFWIKCNLDKVFVVLMGMVAIVSFCITLRDIIITKELLRRTNKIAKIILDISAVCKKELCSIIGKTFLNQIVNSGKFISSNFSIDGGYLSDDSQAYIKKRYQ